MVIEGRERGEKHPKKHSKRWSFKTEAKRGIGTGFFFFSPQQKNEMMGFSQF